MFSFFNPLGQPIFRKVMGTVIGIKRPPIDTRHIMLSFLFPQDRTCFVTIEFKADEEDHISANRFLHEQEAPHLPLTNTWGVTEEELDDIHLESRVRVEIIFQSDLNGTLKRSFDGKEPFTAVRLHRPFTPRIGVLS